MRGLIIPILLVFLVAAAVATVVTLLRQRSRQEREDRLAKLIDAHGPIRCLLAARMLADLAKRGDGKAVAIAWERIELPLLQALPDCPPDGKVGLIAALDAAALIAPREVAKQLITMRNSLVA